MRMLTVPVALVVLLPVAGEAVTVTLNRFALDELGTRVSGAEISSARAGSRSAVARNKVRNFAIALL